MVVLIYVPFVHDIGEKLSVGAVMTGLRRVSVGSFNVSDSVSLNDIDSIEKINKHII